MFSPNQQLQHPLELTGKANSQALPQTYHIRNSRKTSLLCFTNPRWFQHTLKHENPGVVQQFSTRVTLPLKETWHVWRHLQLSTTRGEDATGAWWVEARGDAEHSAGHRTAPYQRMIQSKMSAMPMLGHSGWRNVSSANIGQLFQPMKKIARMLGHSGWRKELLISRLSSNYGFLFIFTYFLLCFGVLCPIKYFCSKSTQLALGFYWCHL